MNELLEQFFKGVGEGGFEFGSKHKDKNRTDSCNYSRGGFTSESLAWVQPGTVPLTRRCFSFLRIISQIRSFRKNDRASIFKKTDTDVSRPPLGRSLSRQVYKSKSEAAGARRP